MPRWIRALRACALVPLWALLAACGGGSGAPGGAEFLTADVHGLGAGAPTAGGAPGAALPGVAAEDSSEDLAREIQQADLWRVAGDTLYLLNPWRGLVTVDLAGPRLLGRLPLTGLPQELLLQGARALVLLNRFDGRSEVLDVDVSDPAHPRTRSTWPLPGPVRTSRLIGSVLVVVTSAAVHSFAVGADLLPADRVDLPQGAAFVHATDTLLAVAAPSDGVSTLVTLVDVSDPGGALRLRGGRTLTGRVASDEALHIGAGTLRVVAFDETDRGLSRLFVLSLADPDAPALLSTLALARGEQLFATRFTDEAAYLVTFERVDPLWIIDLRDPVRPRLAGELIVPGWSSQLVAIPGRLIGLGVDPADGWRVIASLFDVSDPTRPTLLSRVDFGWDWSEAFSDIRALGVFPAEGLLLLPLSDRLAVLTLSASSLGLRGTIALAGSPLRGMPHARGLCALSNEEVVLADPVTLAVRGQVTVAENVVDAVRLLDGRVLTLLARGPGARLGSVDVPLFPERCYPVGDRVAVVGTDALGRAAYVVDFEAAPPALSARLDLGEVWYEPVGVMAGAALPPVWRGGSGLETCLTPGGRLVGRGHAAQGDSFFVLNIPGARLEAPVEVPDAYVSGFVCEGEALLYTAGRSTGTDAEGRPWMRHDLVRVDLTTRQASSPVNVPGYLIASQGGVHTTVEETWGASWSYGTSAVASRVGTDGRASVLARVGLPEDAYDLRAAGATLFFTTGGGLGGGGGGGTTGGGVVTGGGGGGVSVGVSPGAPPVWSDPGGPAMPQTEVRTLRLGPAPVPGPTIQPGAGFLSLLLPQPDAALLVRDGVAVEHWDLAGPLAVRAFTVETGAWPANARRDAAPGSYLLALGYGGLLTAP